MATPVSARIENGQLLLHVNILRSIAPGRSILISLPQTNTKACIIPPCVLRYLALFEQALGDGRQPHELIWINIPLNHEDIRYVTPDGRVITASEREEVIRHVDRIVRATPPDNNNRVTASPAPPPVPAPAHAPEPRLNLISALDSAAIPHNTTFTVNYNGQSHSITPLPGHNVVDVQIPRQTPGASRQDNLAALAQLPPLVMSPGAIPALKVAPASANNPNLQDFVCAICMEFIRKPVGGKCVCTFCDRCMKKWCETKRRGPTTCPTCRMVISLGDIRPKNKFFSSPNIVPDVICPYVGCSTVTNLAAMNAHIETCGFKPMNCMYHSYGCNFCRPKSAHGAHLKSGCAYHGVRGLVDKVRQQQKLLDTILPRVTETNRQLEFYRVSIARLTEAQRQQNTKCVSNSLHNLQLFCLALMSPLKFQEERQKWHEFVKSEEDLSRFVSFFSLFIPLVLVGSMHFVSARLLLKINAFNVLFGADDAALNKLIEMKEAKYISESACALLALCVVWICARPFKSDERTQFLKWAPKDIGPFSEHHSLFETSEGLSIFEVFSYISCTVFWVKVLANLENEGAFYQSLAALFCLLCFCMFHVPNIAVSVINCNRCGDGSEASGRRISSKIRQTSSVGIRLGFLVHVVGFAHAVHAVLITAFVHSVSPLPLCFVVPEDFKTYIILKKPVIAGLAVACVCCGFYKSPKRYAQRSCTAVLANLVLNTIFYYMDAGGRDYGNHLRKEMLQIIPSTHRDNLSAYMRNKTERKVKYATFVTQLYAFTYFAFAFSCLYLVQNSTSCL